MNVKKRWKDQIRGWIPNDSNLTYSIKVSKPRWRKPTWIAFTLVAMIALSFVAFAGVQTYIRYSNPQADVTASYYEKSLNCTTANVGDIVEVNVLVDWHGYVIPEFKREITIVDPYFESNFEFVGGNNTYRYSGYGGGDQFTYLLKVIGNNTQSIELPKPRLYLDGSEISLRGTSAVLEVQTVSESES
jgi:hypothetical protein